MSLIPFSLEFSSFLSALAGFAIALVAWRIRCANLGLNKDIDWRWLSSSAAAWGLSELVTLVALKSSDESSIWIVGLLIQATAWCALLEFGRRGFTTIGGDRRPRLRPWIHAPLIGLALLSTIYGIEGLHFGVAFAIGLPAAVLTGLALLQAGTSTEAAVRPMGLFIVSAALLILALANAFGAYSLCTLSMTACAAGAWLKYCQHGFTADRAGLLQQCAYPATFVLIAIVGWAVMGRGEVDAMQPQLYVVQSAAGTGKPTGSSKTSVPQKPIVVVEKTAAKDLSNMWRQSIPIVVIGLMVAGFWGLSKLPCVH